VKHDVFVPETSAPEIAGANPIHKHSEQININLFVGAIFEYFRHNIVWRGSMRLRLISDCALREPTICKIWLEIVADENIGRFYVVMNDGLWVIICQGV
jgi:hypothetical protein